MQKRFSADTEFQATLLLLQERIPRTGAYHPHVQEAAATDVDASIDETRLRILRSVDSPRPAVHLLSNGRYQVMLTNAGGGYSRCGQSCGDALARGQHARPLGKLLLSARSRKPARSGRRPINLLPPRSRTTKRSSPTARPNSAAASTASIPTPRLPYRPRMTSSFGALPSAIGRAGREASKSRPMPSWFWHPAFPTNCIPLSATCSCRRNCCRPSRRSSPRAGHARARKAAVERASAGRPRRRRRRDFL